MPLKKFRPITPTLPARRAAGLRGADARQAGQVADRAQLRRPAAATTTATSRRAGSAAATSSATGSIDFRRDKDGVPARVASIEYDPNRSARIALLNYARRRAPLHRGAGRPQGRRRCVQSGPDAEIKPGNCLPLKQHSARHQHPQRRAVPGPHRRAWRARPARSASSWRRKATTRSCACRRARCGSFHVNCRAVVGQVGNLDHENVSLRQGGPQSLARPRSAACAAWR